MTKETVKKDAKTGEPILEPTEEELEQQRLETERANSELVAAPPEGEIVVGDNTLTPAPAPDLVGDPGDWDKVLIVANAPNSIQNRNGRKVIVVERRTQPDHKDGAGRFDAEAKYPTAADAYLGYADANSSSEIDRVFPDAQGKPVFLVGHNIRQFSLGGVSRNQGYLSVGPAHPVYAAVNLALQQAPERKAGEEPTQQVEITGLTDYDRSILGPWLDKIAHEFKSLTY